ncbi:MAG: methyltransferase domain-containing protein [Anaerolineae bacterium]|nr:methyltransferase domain-containing protein [Anaerolineae bacterium]
MTRSWVFDQPEATADELWDYCLEEYASSNPVSQILFDRFFATINRIVSVLAPDDRLLEVGCGAAMSSFRILEMLNGQPFQISDVDFRYASKLREIEFPVPVMVESVLALGRASRSVDCVFCLEVLEHIHPYEQALMELFRVSRRYIVLSVPNEPLWSLLNLVRGKYWFSWGNTPGHFNRWSPRAFERLVSRYGKVIAAYHPLPWTVLLARVR